MIVNLCFFDSKNNDFWHTKSFSYDVIHAVNNKILQTANRTIFEFINRDYKM